MSKLDAIVDAVSELSKGGRRLTERCDAAVRADAKSAILIAGESALKNLNFIVELMSEGDPQGVINRNKSDIQRWVAAVKKAELAIPSKIQGWKGQW